MIMWNHPAINRVLPSWITCLGRTCPWRFSFDVYALVHDAELLPLGHTLSYQLGYCAPPRQSRARMATVLAIIKDEIVAHYPQHEICSHLLNYLDTIEAICCLRDLARGSGKVHSRWSDARIISMARPLQAVDELVTGTVSADLIDFSLRDNAAAGWPWFFDTRLLDYLCMFAVRDESESRRMCLTSGTDAASLSNMGFRCGFGLVAEDLSFDGLTAMFALLRARCDIFERTAFGPGKAAADATLDRGLANIAELESSSDILPPEEELLTMTDDQLLDLLEKKERDAWGSCPGEPAIPHLRAGRAFEKVYSICDAGRLSELGRQLAADGGCPAFRRQVEGMIVDRLPDCRRSDIVLARQPVSGQLKEFDTLVGWVGSRGATLQELAPLVNAERECQALAQRHSRLWSVSVFVSPRAKVQQAAVAAVAREMLER